MKKTGLLSILFLVTISTFAQLTKTDAPILGIGEFRFGMNKEQVIAAMKSQEWENSVISSQSESIVTGTNMVLADFLFDHCTCMIRDSGLYSISFTMQCFKKDKDPKDFYELLSILEKDFGKPFNSGSDRYSWRCDTGGVITFYKTYDKKEKRYTITITCVKMKK